jgi:hypothetical protein
VTISREDITLEEMKKEDNMADGSTDYLLPYSKLEFQLCPFFLSVTIDTRIVQKDGNIITYCTPYSVGFCGEQTTNPFQDLQGTL